MSVCLNPKALHLCTRHKLKRGFLHEFYSCAPVLDDFSRRYVAACPRAAPKTAHTFPAPLTVAQEILTQDRIVGEKTISS